MRKNMTTLATTLALCLCVVSATAKSSANTPAPKGTPVPTSWTCEVTQPGNKSNWDLGELDNTEFIGKWLHGTARGSNGADLAYDYYLAYVNSKWVYIQVGVNPQDQSMTYFVGTSQDGTHWQIIYPSERATYTYDRAAGQFTVKYTDLTKVCNRTSDFTPSLPKPQLSCDTQRAGNAAVTEYLSITKLGRYWWQGVATDRPSGGRVIYEYNILSIQGQFISIEINSGSGEYAVAVSNPSQSLDNTTWMVVHPEVETGFAFRNVTYDGGLPTGFTVVFADGYQRCTRI